MKPIKLKNNEILVLRTCASNGKSRNGFVWPKRGRVTAPDWRDDDKCGGGLHGLPWGVGCVSCLSWNVQSNNGWLVKVCTNNGGYQHGTGEMRDKCKFRSGVVVLANAKREECVAAILASAPIGIPVNWSTLTGGYGSTLTGGDWSTLTGGDWSTLTGGYRSTLTGGDWSALTGGDGSTLTGGDWSALTGGDWSTLTGGYRSTLTGGYGSTLTGGYGSTLTGGNWSTLKGGDRSTLKGGMASALVVTYYDRGWKTVARVTTKADANKWLVFEYQAWRFATEEESAAADKKTGGNN